MTKFSHHSHDVAASANVNAARAFRVEIEADEISTCLHRGEGISNSFDSADLDFRHNVLTFERLNACPDCGCLAPGVEGFKPDNSRTFAAISGAVTNASPTR